MLLNLHSYYSLRFGTLSIEQLVGAVKKQGYECAVLTDINNSSGIFPYIRECRQQGIQGLAGIEFRNGDKLLYIGIARNTNGFRELNELITKANLSKTSLPEDAPAFDHVYIVYPFGRKEAKQLKENEFVGIRPKQLNKVLLSDRKDRAKFVLWQPVTFADKGGYELHCQLRAIDHNLLLSQLGPHQIACCDEALVPSYILSKAFEAMPEIAQNTEQLLAGCSFDMELDEVKNKKTFTGSRYDDLLLLEKLAFEGMANRYGKRNEEAKRRVLKELEIIDSLGFSSYFLITSDIVRYGMSRGFYHVGRGSGANSVVAYCLRITDVCPIELDLYFERFLNPKRKSPPDFDIDFSWDERDDVFDYIFKRYGHKHTALMGAMSTFKDKSIIRELGKTYGLPKGEIDRIIDYPSDKANNNEIVRLMMNLYGQMEDFPNLRTIHSSGVLISEEPITAYTALDLPPKGFQTAQIDMYTAEDIGFEKFDILSQRGIGHIKEAAEVVRRNRGIKIDVHEVERFKRDEKIRAQLKTGDTIGCFYIESPAMRQLLKKLRCDDYLTLVAASSIIRPGVAQSGMMREYIHRFHNPNNFTYLHPVMEEQLRETFGVMVFQEDVLKVGHHFGGLDLADADVLRRLMSGKNRGRHHLVEIKDKFFNNCREKGYDEKVTSEVWRQMESFAGYSFSKAHSASFAVESFQSLYLKTYFPLEFMVAVINNFGGFYNTRIYVHEARKAGATIHLPCVNKSLPSTTIYGTDIYLGLVHLKSLESHFAHLIPLERDLNGPYTSMENLITRTGIPLEQLIILIRIGALRAFSKDKKAIMWEAHALLNKSVGRDATMLLFNQTTKKFILPQFETSVVEDVYDELELLGFPVSCSLFEMLRTEFRGEIMARDVLNVVGRTVRMVGEFVNAKYVPTKRKELMAFGAFLDAEGQFFDTTHFPQSFKAHPFQGSGMYLIRGKVTEEFGYPSIEVDRMAKLPIRVDPRSI